MRRAEGGPTMHGKNTRIFRSVAVLITIFALVAAAPQIARAEVEPYWGRWWEEVAQRDTKAEIPFAVLFSIVPMVIITPIWLGMKAYSGLFHPKLVYRESSGKAPQARRP